MNVSDTSEGILRDQRLAGGMLLKKWCRVTGVSPRTARNWRKDPSKNFKTFWKYGMLFVHSETSVAFSTDDGSGKTYAQ